VQRPGFWLRHQGEVLDALAALAGRGDERGRAALPAGWVRDVAAKWMAAADGLTKAYGVPWAIDSRPLRARADSPQHGLPTIVLGPSDRDEAAP